MVNGNHGFYNQFAPSKGKNVIWVKQAHFVPCCKLPTAKELTKLFVQHVVRLYAFSDKMMSNGGSQFVAKFWKEVLDLIGVEQVLSSAYHPQTDGQTESKNAILEQFLCTCVDYQQAHWVSLLPFAEYSYNNSGY